MSDRTITKRAIFTSLIEMLFAVLPLVILGMVSPNHDQKHPVDFWHGPEMAMTACILYGLTVSRLIIGAVSHIKTKSPIRQTFAAGTSFLALMPILGIIFSTIFIAKFAIFNEDQFWIYFQIPNLITAILVFFVLGGYGIRKSEH
jgi:hypothetical protein